MTPFDIVKSVTQTKDNVFDIESVFNKDYDSYIINRALSNSIDTVLFANAMNQYGTMDKKLQYDFYRLGIPKSKKFTKWIGKDAYPDPEALEYICKSMRVSLSRAVEIYDIIGKEKMQIEMKKLGGKK
jgi:hypothetical protein